MHFNKPTRSRQLSVLKLHMVFRNVYLKLLLFIGRVRVKIRFQFFKSLFAIGDPTVFEKLYIVTTNEGSVSAFTESK